MHQNVHQTCTSDAMLVFGCSTVDLISLYFTAINPMQQALTNVTNGLKIRVSVGPHPQNRGGVLIVMKDSSLSRTHEQAHKKIQDKLNRIRPRSVYDCRSNCVRVSNEPNGDVWT